MARFMPAAKQTFSVLCLRSWALYLNLFGRVRSNLRFEVTAASALAGPLSLRSAVAPQPQRNAAGDGGLDMSYKV